MDYISVFVSVTTYLERRCILADLVRKAQWAWVHQDGHSVTAKSQPHGPNLVQ